MLSDDIEAHMAHLANDKEVVKGTAQRALSEQNKYFFIERLKFYSGSSVPYRYECEWQNDFETACKIAAKWRVLGWIVTIL